MEQIESGFVQIKDGFIEKGMEKIEKALRDPDITDDVRFDVAQQYYQLGFIEQAIDMTKKLQEKYPYESELTLFLAECYMENAQEEDGLGLLAEIEPDEGEDYVRAILLASDLYLMEGLYEVAENKVKQALQHYPDEQVLHSALGEVFYAQEKYTLAIASYERGSIISTYSRLADCYAHVGKFEQALDFYKKAVTSEKEHVDLLFGYGFVVYRIEEWGQAIEKFRRVLELDPFYTSVYPLLIEALVKTGAHEDALEFIDQGLKYNQTNPYLFYLKGQALERDKQIQEAKECYEQAIVLDDTHLLSLENLVEILGDEEDWPTALNYLKRMEEISPERSDLQLKMANIYEELEEYSEAEQCYKYALDINPEDIDALNQYAWLLRNEGRMNQALQLWKKSLQINPDQWEVEEVLQRAREV